MNLTLKKEERNRDKKLNETMENRKWILIDFFAADGNKKKIYLALKNVRLRHLV